MHKKHAVLNLAFALLVSAATLAAGAVHAGVAAAAAETTGKGATNAPIPPPRGPHVILSVPVEVENLPPEIDEYSVTCYAWSGVPNATGKPYSYSTGPGTAAEAAIVGKGTASGAIPVGTAKDNRPFKATATVGVFIDFNPKLSWPPDRVAHVMATATWYRCELTLSGTAYQVKTTYLSDTTTIPQAAGMPYAQYVQGQLPH